MFVTDHEDDKVLSASSLKEKSHAKTCTEQERRRGQFQKESPSLPHPLTQITLSREIPSFCRDSFLGGSVREKEACRRGRKIRDDVERCY